jgi:hypothetical protein
MDTEKEVKDYLRVMNLQLLEDFDDLDNNNNNNNNNNNIVKKEKKYVTIGKHKFPWNRLISLVNRVLQSFANLNCKLIPELSEESPYRY